ncbi:mediator complex subunit rgr-1 [Culex quinquefasciatus]|uniref:Mediator complex subunit rgr-1 n=1 Tax=Culex quinquefasciatus TaxID=7176 RepID=B0WFC5_CULQU|nr:mediator complex subunit rgr-1 [Culex quinquefasciatus]|eukprot:XP_001847409.1 mediator complex subunit rgr-1 [Culex quinquefasciatus]
MNVAPDAHMPHPSPSGLMPSSLLNPQPSPIAHLPGPTNMPYMDGQSDTDGSPFTTAHSPAASNWSGSREMLRPSLRPGHYVQSEPQGAGSQIGTRLNIQLYRHSNVILIVEPNEKESSPNEMTYTLYLVLVKPSSVENSQPQDAEPSITSSVSQSGPGSVPPGCVLSVPELSSSAAHPPTSSSTTENDGMPKLYLKVQSLIEFDTFVAMHDPGTYVNELAGSKRKLGALGEGPSKQQKSWPTPWSHCNEKLPLANELTLRRIPHGGLQVEANGTIMAVMKINEQEKIDHPVSIDCLSTEVDSPAKL